MKYTVVIRQAVSDERRAGLEHQLTERFGLNAEQAQRLAGRRTGRLMKPTSRARADLLLNMFQSVGAEVALESVRDETSLINDPFQAAPLAFQPSVPAFPAPDLNDDAPLAPARPGLGASEALGAAQVAWPSPPVMGALAGGAVAGTVAAPLPGRVAVADSAPRLPARPMGETLTVERDSFSSPAFLPGEQSSLDRAFAGLTAPHVTTLPPDVAAPRPAQPSSGPASAPDTDVWTDFTGALTMTSNPTVPEPRPEAAMPVILPVTADEPVPARGRRQSLARRLLLGTLLPLGLATAVTLLLLIALLPRLQGQIVQDQAQTLAAALGTTLTTGSESLSYMQLDTVLKDPNVAFVRIERPGGNTYLRAKDAKVNAAWNTEVAQWTAQHPSRGVMTLAGQSIMVTRLSVVENAIGQPTAVPVTAEKGALIHRITVGLRNDRFTAILRNTTILVILTSLFSLLLASILANRTARAVVQPIEQLVKSADAISMGDLSRPVVTDRNDEIGDLANALERMRLSLESALERLRRRKRE